MSPLSLLIVYCVLIVGASLAGGWLPMLIQVTHARAQMMMSFVSGLMLGVALFQMLPHAAEDHDSLHRAMVWMAAGVLTMFFLLRAFHFHQHGPMATAHPAGEGEPVCTHEHDHGHDHDHGHHHDHDHDHGHGGSGRKPRFQWTGISIGLTLHTLLDGLALAAIVQQDGQAHPAATLGVFLAIVLHKPLDALAITSLMQAGGWSLATRQLVNGTFGMMVPLGAVLFHLGLSATSLHASDVVSASLAFSAGVFLCISLADLLPEIQFHAHDRVKLSALLLAGVGLAYLTGRLEESHVPHGHHGHEESGLSFPLPSEADPNPHAEQKPLSHP